VFRTRLIRIGNSLCVIVPSKILKEKGLKFKDEVELKLQ